MILQACLSLSCLGVFHHSENNSFAILEFEEVIVVNQRVVIILLAHRHKANIKSVYPAIDFKVHVCILDAGDDCCDFDVACFTFRVRYWLSSSSTGSGSVRAEQSFPPTRIVTSVKDVSQLRISWWISRIRPPGMHFSFVPFTLVGSVSLMIDLPITSDPFADWPFNVAVQVDLIFVISISSSLFFSLSSLLHFSRCSCLERSYFVIMAIYKMLYLVHQSYDVWLGPF